MPWGRLEPPFGSPDRDEGMSICKIAGVPRGAGVGDQARNVDERSCQIGAPNVDFPHEALPGVDHPYLA